MPKKPAIVEPPQPAAVAIPEPEIVSRSPNPNDPVTFCQWSGPAFYRLNLAAGALVFDENGIYTPKSQPEADALIEMRARYAAGWQAYPDIHPIH
jgi:hypothetical protein